MRSFQPTLASNVLLPATCLTFSVVSSKLISLFCLTMASPTDFIDVPKVAGEVENFSNVNLGILVTT